MFTTLLDDLYDLNKSMNKMFDSRPYYKHTYWPEVNVYLNNDEYIVVAKVPGLDKKDISITIKDNSLKIEGERKKGEQEGNAHLTERYDGKFERNIMLNEKIDTEHIEAQIENGLLIIKLPKSPETKPKNITIK